MLWIETVLSVYTLLSMLLLSNRHIAAPLLGLLVNFGWVIMWIHTEQYGFLFLGAGILLIYFSALTKQLKGEW